MVQGIFDDRIRDAQTGGLPRHKRGKSRTNYAESSPRCPSARHGLLSFTINIQGGSPEGYSPDQPWHNNGFNPDGSLRRDYLRRLERILDRADELGMAPIVGYFYFGQDQRLENDAAVRRAVRETTTWLVQGLSQHLARSPTSPTTRVPSSPDPGDACARAHSARPGIGRRPSVSVSFNGGLVPPPNVVASRLPAAPGNGVADPDRIAPWFVRRVKSPDTADADPLHEDDHFDFDTPRNNFIPR